MAGTKAYYLQQNWLADIEHYLISHFAAGSDEASAILSKNEAEILEMYKRGDLAHIVAKKFAPLRKF